MTTREPKTLCPAAGAAAALDHFAWWSNSSDVQDALKINAPFLIGPGLACGFDEGVAVTIASNRCCGLDFAAAAQIHAGIVATRNRGAAMPPVSSDFGEILGIADRITVMFNGRPAYATPVAAADLAEIGHRMAGSAGGR